MHHQFWKNDQYIPKIIELWPSQEQVMIIRIGPIMSFMRYSQHHIQLEETHKYVLNHR
jgi:hypothetical protein